MEDAVREKVAAGGGTAVTRVPGVVRHRKTASAEVRYKMLEID
jgi:hypothetical protein